MRCPICKTSVEFRPMMRMNEIGEEGIWWCEDCVALHEPELYKNQKEDQSEIEKELINIFYGKR